MKVGGGHTVDYLAICYARRLPVSDLPYRVSTPDLPNAFELTKTLWHTMGPLVLEPPDIYSFPQAFLDFPRQIPHHYDRFDDD